MAWTSFRHNGDTRKFLKDDRAKITGPSAFSSIDSLCGSIFSPLWNRWSTPRSFQRTNSEENSKEMSAFLPPPSSTRTPPACEFSRAPLVVYVPAFLQIRHRLILASQCRTSEDEFFRYPLTGEERLLFH